MDNDMTSMTTAGQAGALRRLLTSGGLRAVYQPIIDLDTYAPVAYEALVRGPGLAARIARRASGSRRARRWSVRSA
jgi:EAL domain-containing protein (putative c-di-GMP-specific phosphodiesterase class I)